MDIDNIEIIKVVATVLALLIAIIGHEIMHGFVAYKYGDKTAKSLGRLSINPIPHIDIIGSIILPLSLYFLNAPFLIGWAKPVPVEPRYFKSPLVDMALVAVAGPVSNFFMACFWAMFIVLADSVLDPSTTLKFLADVGEKGIYINIILMVLNLLPIPPLDGGRVVAGVLPRALHSPFMQLERFGMVIILLLLLSGLLGKVLWPTVLHFIKIIETIFGL